MQKIDLISETDTDRQAPLSGQWDVVADRLIELYSLSPTARILDAGCGSGGLLDALCKRLPEAQLFGFDASLDAIRNAPDSIRDRLLVHKAQNPIPFPDNHFDLIIALNVLTNMEIFDIKNSLQEFVRAGSHQYVGVEPCEPAASPAPFIGAHSAYAWKWIFKEFGYTGDYGFMKGQTGDKR